MTRQKYSVAQLRACLAAAEYQWSRSGWAEAGAHKAAVHSLRLRLSHAIALGAVL